MSHVIQPVRDRCLGLWPVLAIIGLASTAAPAGTDLDQSSRERATAVRPQLLLDSIRDLPNGGGWRSGGEGFQGATRLGTFPPVTEGPANLIFSSVDREGRASAVVSWVPEPLKADQVTRDALAVASPAAFSEVWGATFRTTWVDLGRVGDRAVIRLRGTLVAPSGEKTALTVWAPFQRGHYVVTAVVDPTGTMDPDAVVDALIGRLPRDEPGRAPESRARSVLVLGLAAVLALALTGGFVMRRRRAIIADHPSARTSGSDS